MIALRRPAMSYSSHTLCISGAPRENRWNRRPSFHNGQNGHVTELVNLEPKHPDYATLQARLASFTGWDIMFLTPESLANAGFYFTGIKDYVRCFCCGIGIKDWEIGDSPWVEHARWSQECAYVKNCLGEEFVRLCQSSDAEDINRREQILLERFNQQQLQVADQITEGLNSTASRLVLEMGYSQSDVIQAIQYARQQYGTSALQARYLLEYLLDHSQNSSFQNSSRPVQSAEHAGAAPSDAAVQSRDTRENYEKMRVPSECKETSKSVSEEEQVLRENRELKEQRICKICLDQEACIVFLPCGHLAACVQCSRMLNNCAICRTRIREKIRVYPA